MPKESKPTTLIHSLFKSNWNNLYKSFLVAMLACYGVATVYPAQVAAHEVIGSVSNSIIITQGQSVDYYLSVPQSIISLLRQLSRDNLDLISGYLAAGLKISTNDLKCKMVDIGKPVWQTSGNQIIHIAFKCPVDVKDLSVSSSLFYDFDDKHIQFIRLANAQNPGKFTHEAALTSGRRLFHVVDVLAPGDSFRDRAYSFFIMGVKHILSGYDHILFLLSVLMMVTTFAGALKVITSFTIAHSITIALAFFDIVSLRPGIVEPLIALSIVYTGVENIIKGDHKWRWMVAFAFGLIHGLGFVGVLKEITISSDELLISLFSFNMGIEAGQVLIASIMAPLIFYIHKRPNSSAILKWSSACIALAGLFWFVRRALV